MIKIDGNKVITVDSAGYETAVDIGTPDAFRILSSLWLRSGWDTKYVYSFSWLGRPIIQLPEDMFRIQEVVYRIKPDVLIETGVAHGGSLIFYASLFKAMNRGRVIGIDIEIRPHNRKAIEAHELSELVTLIESSSTSDAALDSARRIVRPGECCMVVLDSNHTRAHVLAELNAYADFVSVGSYIVACDGIMQSVVGAPRSSPEWITDNPISAVQDFLLSRNDFVLEEPPFSFNEGQITERVTYWPSAFLRRVA